MAVARTVERLKQDLSSAAEVINDLVRENYELREQVVYLLSDRSERATKKERQAERP